MTFTIVRASPSADSSSIAALVNEVYAAAEQGLWIEGTVRVSPAEIEGYAAAGELFVAYDGEELVGAARIQRLPTGEGELGMLVAHPGRRGGGIGGGLISYGESWARSEGLGTMQLELLVPQTWTHPVKQYLYEWYTRLGYRVVRTGTFADDYPELAPRLATPCDYLIFHKSW